MMTPTPQAYARAAVARIGLDTMASPYWAHELVLWIQARPAACPTCATPAAATRQGTPAARSQTFIPDVITGPVVLGMHKGVRYHKKNIAKMEEKQKNKDL